MHLILHFFHFSREKSLKILLASFLKVLAPLHQLQNTFLVQAYKVLTKQSLLLLCFGGEGDAFLQFSCDDAYSVFNLSGHETTLVIVGHTVNQSSLHALPMLENHSKRSHFARYCERSELRSFEFSRQKCLINRLLG